MAGHLPADIFVGRQAELDRLLEALESARRGRGRLVLLSGEPGIGKTRTVAELGGRTPIRLLWGRCHETAGAPPYWPWTQVLRGPLSDPDLAALRDDLGPGAADIIEIVPELRDRLPELKPAPPARDPAEARFRLFDSLGRFLLATARRLPLMIVLDDLHWADVPSLRLLEFLAPELADAHVLLIGTYRETELSRHHPLSDALGGLIREAHVSRLRLTGLDGEEVRHYVALAAGVVPSPALARSIHQQTEGNPLFLREVVHLLSEQGHFAAARDGASVTVRIPEGVRDVIGRRLNRLSPACNEVLTLGAVAGREFSIDVLAQASGNLEDVMLRLLDEAIEARVIEEVGSDRYQFTHALIRETLYDEVRPGQRRRLHHVVGEALEATAPRDPGPVLSDLARHFQASGTEADLARAINYAIRAGRRANSMFAFEDAASLFQAGLDMIEQLPTPDLRTRASLLLNLGETLRRINDFPPALARLKEAARIARAEGFHDVLAEAVMTHELAEWRWGEQTSSESVALLTDVLDVLPETMEVVRVRVMARLARARLYAGDRDAAAAIAREATVRARALGDPAAIAASLDAEYDFGFDMVEQSHLQNARELTRLAEQIGDLELMARSWYQCANYHMILGGAHESREALKAYIGLQGPIRQPVFMLFALGMKTSHAILAGDLAEAEQLILQALRTRSSSHTHASDVTSVLIFDLRRAQGRLSELRPLLQAFTQTSAGAAWRPGLALMHLECGDIESATAFFNELAADDFNTVPRDGRWTVSMVYLAEICAALGDSRRAAVLYRHLRSWAGHNFVLGGGASIPGSADRFLGSLAAAMGRWTDAETHFDAALAMNERIGGLLPLAYTRHDFAAMLLARGFPGDHRRAIELLHQAGQGADALGLAGLQPKIERLIAGAPAPAVPTPPALAPDDLTAREMDVLRLLAIGRGNADIALVLSISLNTVATHVRNILAKTGCANRTEAAAYAMRRGMHRGG